MTGIAPAVVEVSGGNLVLVIVVALIALGALAMAAMFRQEVLAAGEGTDNMKNIAQAVQEGANAYLQRQFRTLAIFAVVAFFLLLALPADDTTVRIFRSVFFLVGAGFSAAVGYLGMSLAVRANLRVAAAAQSEGRDTAVADGQRQRRPEQRRLHVRGHVVRSLERVRPAAEVLGHRVVEPRLEVAPDVRRGVLVERQRRGRVADEEVAEPDAQVAQLGQLAHDLVGHQMEAARPRAQREVTLEPHRRPIVPRACRPDRRGTARPPLRAAPAAARPSRASRPRARRGARAARGRRWNAARCRRSAARRATRRRSCARTPAGSRARARGPSLCHCALTPRSATIRCRPCVKVRTRSSLVTPRRARWASRCSRTGSVSARWCRGPAPASAPSRRSRSASRPTGRTCSTCSSRASRPLTRSRG